MKKLSLSSILLCLTICAGCSTAKQPNIVVQEKLRILKPPASLMTPPDAPQIVEVVAVRDIKANSDAFEAWGQAAVNKLKALSDWYAGQPEVFKDK